MKGQGEPDEAKVASFKTQLNTNLDVYEKILSKQPYLAGDVSHVELYIRFYLIFWILHRTLLWPIYFIYLMVHGLWKLVKIICLNPDLMLNNGGIELQHEYHGKQCKQCNEINNRDTYLSFNFMYSNSCDLYLVKQCASYVQLKSSFLSILLLCLNKYFE